MKPEDHNIVLKLVYVYIKCVIQETSFLTLLPKQGTVNFNSYQEILSVPQYTKTTFLQNYRQPKLIKNITQKSNLKITLSNCTSWYAINSEMSVETNSTLSKSFHTWKVLKSKSYNDKKKKKAITHKKNHIKNQQKSNPPPQFSDNPGCHPEKIRVAKL